VALLPNELTERGEAFRRRDGVVVPVLRSELVYSTADHLAIEQRFVDRVRAGARAHAGTTPESTVSAAVGARPTLSAEQRTMVRSLCRDGDRVSVAAGKAGTGKTFALAAANAAWQAAALPVVGAAVARRAGRELELGAGIASTSVAALLAELETSGARGLPTRCVLVVDEAGMVPTRQLAMMLDHVERVGGKLVLVGDHRQLPELEAGGAFRGLVRRGVAVELTENRRQSHGWERDALDHLRDGRVPEALIAYQAHGRVHIEGDGAQARAALVRDWWAPGELEGAVMIARRRGDVADLNRRARVQLQDAGVLGREQLHLPGGAFAPGDVVVVKRNNVRLGVHNGDRARVVGVDRRRAALELDCHGRRVELDADFLLAETERGEPTMLHGYAITGHIAQGLTVDRAYVLADSGLSGEWAYTAMSRGRSHNALYFAGDRHEAREEFAPPDTDTRRSNVWSRHSDRAKRQRSLSTSGRRLPTPLRTRSKRGSTRRERLAPGGKVPNDAGFRGDRACVPRSPPRVPLSSTRTSDFARSASGGPSTAGRHPWTSRPRADCSKRPASPRTGSIMTSGVASSDDRSRLYPRWIASTTRADACRPHDRQAGSRSARRPGLNGARVGAQRHVAAGQAGPPCPVHPRSGRSRDSCRAGPPPDGAAVMMSPVDATVTSMSSKSVSSRGSSVMDRLYEIAAGQGGFIAAHQAVDAGVPRSTLSYHATEGDALERVAHGVYRIRRFPTPPHGHVIAGWLALAPADGVISHESALELLDLTDLIADEVHVTLPRSKRGLRTPPGVRIHLTDRPIDAEHRRQVLGVPVTSVERTLADLLRSGGWTEQIELGVRQATRRGLTTRRRLEAEFPAKWQARLQAALADGAAV
jgi:hypothetical protein